MWRWNLSPSLSSPVMLFFYPIWRNYKMGMVIKLWFSSIFYATLLLVDSILFSPRHYAPTPLLLLSCESWTLNLSSCFHLLSISRSHWLVANLSTSRQKLYLWLTVLPGQPNPSLLPKHLLFSNNYRTLLIVLITLTLIKMSIKTMNYLKINAC